MRQLNEPVPVSQLELDPANPRLPEDVQGKSQAEILAYLFEHDVLTELADSYITNGYFINEQILVLPENSAGLRVVVEGNRRLGALMYLLQTTAAHDARLPEHVTDPPVSSEILDRLRAVPAIEVQDREELAAYLGFRHISGLKTWAPEAKARYLYNEVEQAQRRGDPDPFYTVGRRVGSNAPGVRNAYHAYNILRIARDELGLRTAATSVLTDRFGVWTRLLGTANVAAYIGLGTVTRAYESVINSAKTIDRVKLAEVLDDMTPGPDGKRALLHDSRDVTDYSAVLAKPEAYVVLRKFGRLDLAAEIANGSDFDRRLTRAQESLQVATREVLEGVTLSPSSLAISKAIQREARNLTALIESAVQSDAGDVEV